ncbi:cyclin-A1-1 [Tanacetum coccineum]
MAEASTREDTWHILLQKSKNSNKLSRKYEEVCASKVEGFCHKTNNEYFKEEVLQKDSSVLNFLEIEITTPTVGCFLRIFVRVAQEVNEVRIPNFEYIVELSLLEYNMLRYAPSLVVASAIFLG